MALKTVPQSNESIIIDSDNLEQIKKHSFILDIPKYWHKFVIEDVHELNRNVVLKIFLDSIKPLDLIPLCYTNSGTGSFFFARLCGEAIQKFCENKLVIENPHDSNKSFRLKIILRYSSTDVVKLDVSDNVLSVLYKRFKAHVLYLNNFSEDPDLSEFFPLSQPRLLAFVLNVAKNLKPKAIKLCNNEISTLDAFKIMPKENLVSLDLRHNMIKDLIELKYLENFRICELWLEGNPLCELYDEYNYVQRVIGYCPEIEKLDGFLLRQNGIPSFRRNFLCNVSSYEVVDQFLEHYFPSYDIRNLLKLETFYHKDALFSITAEYFKEQLSSPTAQLKSYKQYSRNLLDFPDGAKNLYVGSTEIMKLFNMLPRCEHDPYSFTVDVLYYTPKCAIVVVTGVFREILNIQRIFGFNRYFVLECRDEAYRIVNEQMHVFNALTSQQVTAFKKTSILQEAKNPVQQNQMVNTFAFITDLTKEWAKLFLEENHYNLKSAILLFVDLYKDDKIPSLGFKNVD